MNAARTLSRCLLAASIAAVAIGSAAQAAQPAGAFFDGAVRIANGSYSHLSMAVDAGGRRHIAAQRPNGDVVYLTDRTGPWTEVVAADGSTASETSRVFREPSLALDENGRVTIAVVRAPFGGTGCDCTDGIFTFSDKGRPRGTFPAAGTKRTGGGTHAPSLKTADGNLYLAYRAGATLPEQDARIRFKTDAGGAFTDVLVSSFGYHTSSPSLRIADNGRARIAFDSPGGIKLATAGSDTGSFSVQKVTGTNGTDVTPQLTLDSLDRAHIAWTRFAASDSTRLARRVSGQWIVTIVGSHAGEVAMTVDENDDPLVVVADDTGTDAGAYTYAGPALDEYDTYGPKASDPQVRVAADGEVSITFTSPVNPKGIHLVTEG